MAKRSPTSTRKVRADKMEESDLRPGWTPSAKDAAPKKRSRDRLPYGPFRGPKVVSARTLISPGWHRALQSYSQAHDGVYLDTLLREALWAWMESKGLTGRLSPPDGAKKPPPLIGPIQWTTNRDEIYATLAKQRPDADFLAPLGQAPKAAERTLFVLPTPGGTAMTDVELRSMSDPTMTPAGQLLLDDLRAAELFVKHPEGAAYLALHNPSSGSFSGDEAWAKMTFEQRLELANAIRKRKDR